MEKIFLRLLFCIALIATNACNKDDISLTSNLSTQKNQTLETKATISVNESELNSFLNNNFIEINHDTLRINGTKDYFIALGYSYETYDIIKKELTSANIIIREMISELNTQYGINDISVLYENDTEIPLNCNPIPIKYRSESGGGGGNGPTKGVIVTNGQEEGSQRGWAPTGTMHVECQCMSYVALTPVHVVSTRALGSAIIKSRVGTGKLNVPLDASNTYFNISYRTTDSYGGECSWNI